MGQGSNYVFLRLKTVYVWTFERVIKILNMLEKTCLRNQQRRIILPELISMKNANFDKS